MVAQVELVDAQEKNHLEGIEVVLPLLTATEKQALGAKPFLDAAMDNQLREPQFTVETVAEARKEAVDELKVGRERARVTVHRG